MLGLVLLHQLYLTLGELFLLLYIPLAGTENLLIHVDSVYGFDTLFLGVFMNCKYFFH